MQPHARIATVYLVVGLAWILGSDLLLARILPDAADVTRAQTLKGTLFVVVTAALLFFLVRSQLRRIEAAERAKREVFASTMQTVMHILNNFLNSMLWFRETAEDTDDFDRSVLEEYDSVIRETADRIRALATLEDVDVGRIESHLAATLGPREDPAPRP